MRVLLVASLFVLAGCTDFLDGITPTRAEPSHYVSDDEFSSWIIEVDYVEDARPPQSALDLLKQRMTSVVSKPSGITVHLDDAIPDTGGRHTTQTIQALADEHRDDKHGDAGIAHTYVIYLDGRWAENEDVLGVAFGGDMVALFSERIEQASNILVSSTTVHRAVLVHELGHIIGLVDNGIPMVNNHEDPEHPGHSDNQNSVMYWAVETTNIVNLVRNGGTIPTDFDADDRADLCAAGGRC